MTSPWAVNPVGNRIIVPFPIPPSGARIELVSGNAIPAELRAKYPTIVSAILIYQNWDVYHYLATQTAGVGYVQGNADNSSGPDVRESVREEAIIAPPPGTSLIQYGQLDNTQINFGSLARIFNRAPNVFEDETITFDDNSVIAGNNSAWEFYGSILMQSNTLDWFGTTIVGDNATIFDLEGEVRRAGDPARMLVYKGRAVQAVLQALTTTLTLANGCTLTPTVPVVSPATYDWVCEITCDFDSTAVSGVTNEVGQLFVNGVGQPSSAVFTPMTNGQRATVSQHYEGQWTGAPPTFELRVSKTANVGTYRCIQSNTTIRLQVFA